MYKEKIFGLIAIAAFLWFKNPEFLENIFHTQEKEIEKLVLTPVQNIDPDKLGEYFNLNSNNTDIQRETMLKQIKGKVIEWRLPVYEVSKEGSTYRIQTEGGVKVFGIGDSRVGTMSYVTPSKNGDKEYIEGLKTGDKVKIKGIISGTFLRTIELKPAIVIR